VDVDVAELARTLQAELARSQQQRQAALGRLHPGDIAVWEAGYSKGLAFAIAQLEAAQADLVVDLRGQPVQAEGS
jgi:hypothetical protein